MNRPDPDPVAALRDVAPGCSPAVSVTEQESDCGTFTWVTVDAFVALPFNQAKILAERLAGMWRQHGHRVDTDDTPGMFLWAADMVDQDGVAWSVTATRRGLAVTADTPPEPR